MLTFPRSKFVDENNTWTQLDHVQSEFKELIDAYFNDPAGRMAEEAGDLIHSVETFLRILQERQGINLDEVQRHIQEKNRQRGYYGNPT